jgi:transcriptional regulator with PAS, ATPase and Fis domain
VDLNANEEKATMGKIPAVARQSEAIHEQAVRTLFELLSSSSEGSIAVDRESRIAWISEKYVSLLGLTNAEEALGRPIEDIIPNSRMREIVETGQPILLDLMNFKRQSFVVTRIPLRDETGDVTGAVGFALYNGLQHLKPLVAKFSELHSQLAQAKRELAEHRRAKYSFSSFIGSSTPCLELKRTARRAAQLDAAVLLLGETGTGKELLAHAIHAGSPRANMAFVGVNLAAIPDTLLEAEFFGVAPGAYTGAERKGRDGKFKLADGGTLFLDEVGDMPQQLQAKLLRALQEQEIEPIGSNRLIKVDVRVIAATSRDLKQLVDSGQFRADLYYRLNVLPIRVPPLRERLSDLESMCDTMLEEIAKRTGLAQCELSRSAIAYLASYDWPGNVRELRNVLEQAAMLSERSQLTDTDFKRILPLKSEPIAGLPAVKPVRNLADAAADAERQAIESAMLATGGKKLPAAKLLGISRATLYEKLASLGMN